jgi:hypothetical protein
VWAVSHWPGSGTIGNLNVLPGTNSVHDSRWLQPASQIRKMQDGSGLDKTHVNAAAIAGGVFVSLTRLAICRVAILHLAGIIPTVKVLEHVKYQPRGNHGVHRCKLTPHPL